MKSYTDLSQSRRLAKILNHESADMRYEACYVSPKEGIIEYESHPHFAKCIENCIPCWSLTALLGALEHPRCFQGDKPTYWFCGCLGKDKLYHEVEADNPIDACYEMILKLHELKML